LLHNSSSRVLCSQRSFGCVVCITKYSFEIEAQLMITTISKSIPKFQVLEMDNVQMYSISLINSLRTPRLALLLVFALKLVRKMSNAKSEQYAAHSTSDMVRVDRY
jgi:hypothetical protein